MCECVIVDKDRELCEAQAEIKALRFSERLREKAVEEVLIFCIFTFLQCDMISKYYLSPNLCNVD